MSLRHCVYCQESSMGQSWNPSCSPVTVRWQGLGSCFRAAAALLTCPSSTMFPGSGRLVWVQEELVESLKYIWSQSVRYELWLIRLNQSTSGIRPVTGYFYISEIESPTRNKDVWEHIRIVVGMSSPGLASWSNYQESTWWEWRTTSHWVPAWMHTEF